MLEASEPVSSRTPPVGACEENLRVPVLGAQRSAWYRVGTYQVLALPGLLAVLAL